MFLFCSRLLQVPKKFVRLLGFAVCALTNIELRHGGGLMTEGSASLKVWVCQICDSAMKGFKFLNFLYMDLFRSVWL